MSSAFPSGMRLDKWFLGFQRKDSQWPRTGKYACEDLLLAFPCPFSFLLLDSPVLPWIWHLPLGSHFSFWALLTFWTRQFSVHVVSTCHYKQQDKRYCALWDVSRYLWLYQLDGSCMTSTPVKTKKSLWGKWGKTIPPLQIWPRGTVVQA